MGLSRIQRPGPSKVRRRVAQLAAAAFAVAGAALASSGVARSQALDITQPEVTKGESELRSVNVFNGHYGRDPAGFPRSTHELSYSTSPTDWINVTLHLELDDVHVDGWRADHIGFESVIPLLRTTEAAGGLAVSWYTTVQVSTDQLSTNSLVFGPIAKLSTPGGKGWLTINPNFEDQFGRNAGPGLNILYGWQARWRLDENLAIGVDGFGKVPDFTHSPLVQDQDHRIGPAVATQFKVAGDRTITVDTALLVGLTETSPELSLKFNVGAPF